MNEDSVDRFSDYYFRDSFEHSSSESQLVENNSRILDTSISHRSSRSQTPLLHSQVDGRVNLPNVPNTRFKKCRSCKPHSAIKYCGLILIGLVLIFVFAIMLFESNYEMFISFRTNPNVILLKVTYWDPIKQYLQRKTDDLLLSGIF